jgi:hypothetical protein
MAQKVIPPVRQKLYGDFDPYSELVEVLPYDEFGWFSEHKYFVDIINLDKPKLIVEVGSYLGKSARMMAAQRAKVNGDAFEIVCVDTWCGSEEHWAQPELGKQYRRRKLYEQFLSNNIQDKLTDIITPFRIDSFSASRVFRRLHISPDLVYVDGSHDYAAAKQDITNWASLMHPGSCMIVDDMWYDQVRDAVKDTIIASGKGVWTKDDQKFIWRKPA